VRVALQAVTMGTSYEANETFIAGAPPFQLQAWVNGATDKSVTWTLNSGVGSLSSAGVYTPPASVPSLQSAVVTATSNADRTVSRKFNLAVLPAGGVVRITAGKTADYMDSQGNLWLADQMPGRPLLGIASNGVSYNETGTPWQTPDPALYNFADTGGTDNIFAFHAPPGNYKITLKENENGDPNNRQRYVIDSQGQIIYRDINPGLLAGGPYIPIDLPLPATVAADGNLYFAMRTHGLSNIVYQDQYRTIYGSNGELTQLYAYTIEPDSSAPRITVTPASGGGLTIGKQVQFTAVGWYMPSAVNWVVTSGPGTIDAHGMYTAPPAPPQSGSVPVTITAISQGDPGKTATATLAFVAGTMILSPANATIVHGTTQPFVASINGQTNSRVTWSVSRR